MDIRFLSSQQQLMVPSSQRALTHFLNCPPPLKQKTQNKQTNKQTNKQKHSNLHS